MFSNFIVSKGWYIHKNMVLDSIHTIFPKNKPAKYLRSNLSA